MVSLVFLMCCCPQPNNFGWPARGDLSLTQGFCRKGEKASSIHLTGQLAVLKSRLTSVKFVGLVDMFISEHTSDSFLQQHKKDEESFNKVAQMKGLPDQQAAMSWADATR